MNRYFLGIDNGGTMTKAALFDGRGKEIGSSSRASILLTPGPGYTERNMETLWRDTAQVVKETIQNAGVPPEAIAAVACTGHGKGLYLWGNDGAPVRNGIVSTDTRAKEYVEKWQADGTALRVYDKTLQKIVVSQPCALLAWIRDHEPENYHKIQWIFEAKDYIRFRLTGNANGEITDYSGTNLINLHTCAYDMEILRLFGLTEISNALPPLVHSSERCGAVTQEAALATGLAPGTPVAGGMFDIDACAIASGVTDGRNLCMIAGTWSINEYISREPVNKPGISMNSVFCIPGYYLVEESSPTSAGNLEWFVKSVLDCEREQAKQRGENIYAKLDALVEQIPPEECDVLFLPYLFGAPGLPQANAVFFGMTARHTKAHLARAIFEGIAFCHKEHMEMLLKLRSDPACIRLSGGAANSRVWVQMFADILGFPVETIPIKEPGALGCAIAGAVAAGIYNDYPEAVENMLPKGFRVEPNPAAVTVYAEKYKAYRGLAETLRPLWR